jgi:desmoplakin
MSDKRFSELRELQGIIEEISRAIMWVNEREEEELVFDWGDKNIEQYIPRKQEGYSVRATPIHTASWVLVNVVGVEYRRYY